MRESSINDGNVVYDHDANRSNIAIRSEPNVELMEVDNSSKSKGQNKSRFELKRSKNYKKISDVDVGLGRDAVEGFGNDGVTGAQKKKINISSYSYEFMMDTSPIDLEMIT